MCSQYITDFDSKEIENKIGVQVEVEFNRGHKILPYILAPIVVGNKLDLFNFSLIPSWSKEARLKFATHNARLETIDEKATWKTPFLKKHAFVPMSSFIEPIYEGELAGNMIAFQTGSLLFAAAIYDNWTNKDTGEVIDSFSIITSQPCDFVKKSGHDRQPVFLNLENAKKWNCLEGPSETLKTFLQTKALTPNFQTFIDRPLKAGWEKRKKK
jgi:putative SOS response-associated peptidase YedK